MKTRNKIISMLLMAVMILSMTITVFAEDNYSITIRNDDADISIVGNTYSAYKVFDVTYETRETKDDNDQTILVPTGAYSYTVASEFEEFTYTVGEGEGAITYDKTNIVRYIESLSDNAAELDAFAKAVFNYATTNNIAAKNSVEATEDNVTKNGNIETLEISLSEPGYYLVGGSVTGPENQTIVAACALDTTDPSTVVNVKADAPDVDKVIVEADSANGGEGKGTAQDVGSTVNFKVTSEVPNMKGYTFYDYTVTDTMSSGLTPVDENNDGKIDVVVKVGGVEYPEKETVSGVEVTNYVVSTTSADGVFTIDFERMLTLTPGAAIEITYSAIINENALATDVETNKVKLTYSNNPYDENDHGTTPDHPVYVYDFDIIVDKFAADNTAEDTTDNQRLEGAKFVLYRINDDDEKEYYKFVEGENGATDSVSWVTLDANETVKAAVEANKITEVTTDAQGVASFKGLDSGTYYMHETEAPAGFNKLENDVTVTITVQYAEDGTIALDDNNQPITNTTKEGNGQYYLKQGVENNSGSRLPSTGGIGTTIFYIIGGILVVGSVVLLITRRRMSSEK